MIRSTIHPQAAERQRASFEASLLETPTDPYLDALVNSSKHALSARTVFVSLLDQSRFWLSTSQETPTGPCLDAIFLAQSTLNHQQDWIPDASKDSRFSSHPLVANDSGVRFFACQPLLAPNGLAIGSFCIASEKPLMDADKNRELFLQFAKMAEGYLQMIQLKNHSKRLRDAFESIKKKAMTDPLTKAWNRMGLDHFFAIKQHDSLVQNKRIALIYCDLDHFKKINDQYGHAVGDIVLCEFSKRIRASISPDDILVRQGGEEFVVLTLCEDDEEAMAIAEHIRLCIMNNPVTASGHSMSLTVSIGATISPSPANVDVMLKEADEALYKAKHAGRNRSVLNPLSKICAA